MHNAKELDEGYDVDLYYFGARYYDAALGRFISPDPIRWYSSPYPYAANSPIMLIDPDGKIIGELLVGIAVGLLIDYGVKKITGKHLQEWTDEGLDAAGNAMANGLHSLDNALSGPPGQASPPPPFGSPDNYSPQPDATGTGGSVRP